MIKRFTVQRLFLLMSATGLLGLSNLASAAAFQLWEQDGATVGNYHAGRAAEAPDASTAYYNPAGLIRMHNQEIVFALDPILTNFKYNGTVNVITSNTLATGPQPDVAQGGNFSVVPSLNYAAPLSDRWVFGFSVVSPFGLKTDYSGSTTTQFAIPLPPFQATSVEPSRYVATLTSLQVIDVSPSLGFAVNDKLSLGAGVDIEHLRGEFDLVAGNPILNALFSTNEDTISQNIGTSYGYGYHLGALYQFNQQTRVGLSYHSKITHHLEGSSKFYGHLATNDYQSSPNLKTDATLPATTTLSVFHTINPVWDIMGTVIYTQWNTFTQLTLQNVAGISNGMNTNSLTVVIPEHYHNTWNYSVGANYHANEQWMFRGGVGFDQSPASDTYRNLQLPDSDRIVLAVGAHFQPNKTVGFDAGWSHYFVMNTRIHNLTQTFGDQTTVTNGSVHSSADVFGFQVKWDIA